MIKQHTARRFRTIAFVFSILFAISAQPAFAQDGPFRAFLPTIQLGQSTQATQALAETGAETGAETDQLHAALTGAVAIVGHGNNCLDIPYQNNSNGANLHMWDCNGTVAQQWTLTSNGRIMGMGKCLDVEGPYAGNGVNVQVWDCQNVAQHYWSITSAGQIKSYDGRCLDVRGWGTANGTAVQLWNCTNPVISAQTWQTGANTSPSVKIDWAFIEQLEGYETVGYVPRKADGVTPLDQSGVTIASGFDLGQHDRNYLVRIGLPSYLVNILTPYMGRKKWNAVNYLNANPLRLSDSEAQTINRKVKPDKANEIIKTYNAASSVPFEQLAKGPQTVITSVAFQYGSNLARKTPTFWGLVTRQDWNGTIRELRDFGDRYPTRRNKEANYLANNR